MTHAYCDKIAQDDQYGKTDVSEGPAAESVMVEHFAHIGELWIENKDLMAL